MAEAPETTEQEAPRYFAKEIVREMVQLYSRKLGRGPTKARIIANTNAVLVIFEDGLTKSEHTLIGAGDADQVTRNRQRITEAMRLESTAIIESLTGARLRPISLASILEQTYRRPSSSSIRSRRPAPSRWPRRRSGA